MKSGNKYQIWFVIAVLVGCGIPFLMSFLLHWNQQYLIIGFLSLLFATAWAYSLKEPKFVLSITWAFLATTALLIVYAFMGNSGAATMGIGTLQIIFFGWGLARFGQQAQSNTHSAIAEE